MTSHLAHQRLIQRVIEIRGLEDKATMRGKTVGYINTFLGFCVGELGFNDSFRPIEKFQAKQLRGTKPSLENKSTTISDQEILDLMRELEDNNTATAHRWANVIRLLSTYGLRPEEIRHLAPKRVGKELQLWCNYEKKAGGTRQTQARRLYPLFVGGEDWDLLNKFDTLDTPIFAKAGDVSQRLNDYLKGQPIWQAMVKEKNSQGDSLSGYTFRQLH